MDGRNGIARSPSGALCHVKQTVTSLAVVLCIERRVRQTIGVSQADDAAGVVWVIDDEADLRSMYRIILEGAGYQIVEAQSAAEVHERLRDPELARPDAVVLDVSLGADNGLSLLSALQDSTGASVLVATASRQVEDAVFALKNGAFDYLTKPVGRDDLLLAIRNGVERRQMQRELTARRALDERASAEEGSAVFASLPMRLVRATLEKVRDRGVPVLVLGESGTGKEVIARWIHDTGARRSGPFVAVNCAALPSELAEAELFGHEQGAFTGADRTRKGRFEEASGGTLFLDEIGELELTVQAKLLRVLEEGKVARLGGTDVAIDTRIVAATNRDLVAEVAAGRFRQDLFYRLEVISVHLPPLRDRLEELPALADFLLRRFAEREGLDERRLGVDAVERLAAHDWPGNIRELENVLKRSCLLSQGPMVEAEHLVFSQQPARAAQGEAPPVPPVKVETRRMRDMPEELARETMVRALAETRGNVSAAARRLGIGRSTFYRHARQLGLPT